jgi:S-(hydroxymethyl)glutathione dehydrogenase/alcohol dehydrogenase
VYLVPEAVGKEANAMKAAVLVAANAPLELCDIDIPKLDVGQVLVGIHYSGICGKQIDEIVGRRPDPYLPHLLGHEGAGVVADVGPGVRKVRPGDSVVLHWMKGSGIDSATPQFRVKGRGTPVNAGCVTTFSDYTIASENRLTRIPSGVKADVAALLGCAVTTGLGIVFNNANVKPGESIAVFGVGGVGLNVIQGAVLVNAHPIVAIDLFDQKLDVARSFGATHCINARNEDVLANLQKLSDGRGIDVCVDTTGNRKVRETAYDATAPKGRTIFAGVPDAGEKICIDSFPIHFGRRLIGSHGGETRPDEDIPRYLKLSELGKLQLEPLITHRFPLEQINEAIGLVRSGGAGRCLVQMN